MSGAFLLSSATAQLRTAAADDDNAPVELPIFTINTEADRGYYATNSISGTMVNTPLMDLPLSMQVFTEEFILDINAFDISDVFVYSSNVNHGNAPATFEGETNQPFMRGLQGGLVQRNGLRRLRVAAAANIERVEVLKGPSSLLYGQIEPGGVVNYITKRPTPNQRFSLRQQFGSFETYRTVFDANVPLFDKRLGFRLVGMMSDAGNYIDRMHTNAYQFNPVLTWWIRPKTQLTIEYDYTSRKVRGQRIGLPQDGTALRNYTTYPWASNITRGFNLADPNGYYNQAIELFGADFQTELFSGLTLRTNYTYSVRDGAHNRVGATGITGANANLLGRPGNRQTVRQPESWFQANLHHSTRVMGIGVKTLIGYENKWDEFQNLLTATSPAGLLPQWDLNNPATWTFTMPTFPTNYAISVNTGRRVRAESKAFFVTNQLSFFNDRVLTLAGVRRDDVLVSAWNVNTPNVPAAVDDYPVANTPQAGIVFKPHPGVAIYAAYSESFIPQFAGQKQRPDGSWFTPQPFTGEGLDVGVKFELFNSKVAGTITRFRVENTNQMQQLPNQIDPATGDVFTPWVQDGAVDHSSGWEVDLRLMPLENTQVVFAYGHMNAYKKKDVVTPIREGLRLGNAPENTYSVFVKQNLGKMGVFENISLTGGVRYVDEIVAGVVPGAWRMDDYTIVTLGANARFKMGKASYNIGINVQNAFDKLYRQDVHSFGPPRSINLNLGVAF